MVNKTKCFFCLRNDSLCVEWGVKAGSLSLGLGVLFCWRQCYSRSGCRWQMIRLGSALSADRSPPARVTETSTWRPRVPLCCKLFPAIPSVCSTSSVSSQTVSREIADDIQMVVYATSTTTQVIAESSFRRKTFRLLYSSSSCSLAVVLGGGAGANFWDLIVWYRI